MLFAPLFHLLTAMLLGLYDSLPAWNFTLGGNQLDGQVTSGGDGGGFGGILLFVGDLDRFIPVHDCLIPVISLELSIAVGLIIFKAIKFILSLIPTISASG